MKFRRNIPSPNEITANRVWYSDKKIQKMYYIWQAARYKLQKHFDLKNYNFKKNQHIIFKFTHNQADTFFQVLI